MHEALRRVLGFGMRYGFKLVAMLLVVATGVGSFQPSRRAIAAPEVASGTFTLSNPADSQVLYTSSTTDTQAAVTVELTSGTVAVEKSIGDTWSQIGTVNTTQCCVFEGEFERIRVKATVQQTAGRYSNRAPTDDTSNTDHTIGTGATTLGSQALLVYSAQTSQDRNIVISTGSGTVELRETSSGGPVLAVGPHSTLAYHGLVSQFWVSGTDKVTFTVLDQPGSLTWMQLPTGHWTDPFSPLSTDANGQFLEGSAAQDGEESQDPPLIGYNWYNTETGETEARQAVGNEAIITFAPTMTESQIRSLFDSLDIVVLGAWYSPDLEHEAESISWFHVAITEASEYYDDEAGFLACMTQTSGVESVDYNDALDLPDDDPEHSHISDGNPRDEWFQLEGEYQSYLADLHASEAWAVEYGASRQIGVAVIDSGVDVGHPDLEDQIYRHPTQNYRVGAAATKSGKRWGNIDSDNRQQSSKLSKTVSPHGTSTAGIVAAETDNGPFTSGRGVGVASCGPGLTVMSIRLRRVSDTKVDTASIGYAIKMLASVFNSGSFPNQKVVLLEVADAKPHDWDKMLHIALVGDSKKGWPATDRTFVAAAGNVDGSGTREKRMYPAAFPSNTSYSDVKVIGVTGVYHPTSGSEYRYGDSVFWNGGGDATDYHREVYEVTAYFYVGATTDRTGANNTHPGYFELDTGVGNYVGFAGTSAAAPQVAALAGLLYAQSASMTANDAYDLIVRYPEGSNQGRLPNSVTGGTGSGDKTVSAVVHFYDILSGQ